MLVLPLVILSLSLWVQTLIFREDQPNPSEHSAPALETAKADKADKDILAKDIPMDMSDQIVDGSNSAMDSADSDSDP